MRHAHEMSYVEFSISGFSKKSNWAKLCIPCHTPSAHLHSPWLTERSGNLTVAPPFRPHLSANFRRWDPLKSPGAPIGLLDTKLLPSESEERLAQIRRSSQAQIQFFCTLKRKTSNSRKKRPLTVPKTEVAYNLKLSLEAQNAQI